MKGSGSIQRADHLGNIAAECGRIPNGEILRWAMQLLSVTVQRGTHLTNRPSCDLLVDVPPQY